MIDRGDGKGLIPFTGGAPPAWAMDMKSIPSKGYIEVVYVSSADVRIFHRSYTF